MRHFHTGFYSGCTHLHSYQQCTRILFSPQPQQHICYFLFVCLFFIIAILVGVRWYFIGVLIFMSLIINNVGHHFMCLLAIYVSSLEKCLFRISAHFRNQFFFFFCYWVIWVLYIFWILAPYQMYYLQIFYPIR